MSFNSLRCAILAVALSVFPALAQADIVVSDPYARLSRPNAPSGAAFMTIENTGSTSDRLLSAASDVAMRTELHSHVDQGDGVMKMVEIEGGIDIPAGGTHEMKRGGDHVMFMGLNTALEQGDTVSITLTFERAGEITLTIPVDNERKDAPGH